MQFVFRQFEFADRLKILDRDIVDRELVPRSHHDQIFSGSGTGGSHFADRGGDTVDVFECVGEPGTFAVLQPVWNVARQLTKNIAQPLARRRLAVKAVNVRREQHQDGHDRAQRLHAFDHVAAADLLDELFEQPKGQLFGHGIRHQKSPALRLDCAFELRRADRLRLRFVKLVRQLFPQRHVRRFHQVENSSRDDALREDGRFVPEGQLGRIASLHEAREHLLHQRCTRPEFFLEAVLNETGHRVIKAVRQRQRRAAVAFGVATSFAHEGEKCLHRIRRRRLGVSRGEELPAVIVRTADKDFLPRLGMCGREVMSLGKLVDLCWRQ